MKVISYELGQLIYLLPTEDIRPAHGIHPASLISKIVDRYRFLGFPSPSESLEQILQEGYKFQSGRFLRDGVEINILELGVYNDGFVVNCYNTDDSDYFMKEIMDWAYAEFGIKQPTRSPVIRYHSRVIVEFENKLSKLIKSFNAISKLLTKKYSELYAIELPFDINRLSLKSDPLGLLKNATETEFIIERRLGSLFEHERYISAAPFSSAVHLDILKEFEQLG